MVDYIEDISTGEVIRVFSKIGRAALGITSEELEGSDTMKFGEDATDLEHYVDSTQGEHEKVEEVEAGRGKLKETVRENDAIYIIIS